MTLYFRRGIIRSTFVALLLALVFWLLLGYAVPAQAAGVVTDAAMIHN